MSDLQDPAINIAPRLECYVCLVSGCSPQEQVTGDPAGKVQCISFIGLFQAQVI